MLWTCTACTTNYAPGPRCPHCGSTDYVPQGEPMPKNTIADGASNAVTGLGPTPEEPAEETPAAEEPEPTNGPTPERPEDELKLLAELEEEAEEEAEEPAPVRPADSAPKADWVAHVAALAPGSADDFGGLTKADLIDLASRLESA